MRVLLSVLILGILSALAPVAVAQCDNYDWGAWTTTCAPGLEFRVKYERKTNSNRPRPHLWKMELLNASGQIVEFDFEFRSPNDPTPREGELKWRKNLKPNEIGKTYGFFDVDCRSNIYLYLDKVEVNGRPYPCSYSGNETGPGSGESDGGGGNQGDPLPPPKPPDPPRGSIADVDVNHCYESTSFSLKLESDLWPVQVQWEIAGALQPVRIVSQRRDHYRIPVTLADGGKQVRARLQTAAGITWTNYATLTVTQAQPPTATEMSPASQNVDQGTPASIHLTHDASYPFEHEILFNGAPLTNEVSLQQYGSGRQIGIYFSRAAVSHNGVYTLRVKNCAGVLEQDFEFTVKQFSPTSVMENPRIVPYPTLQGLQVHFPALRNHFGSPEPAEGKDGERWHFARIFPNHAITFGATSFAPDPNWRNVLVRYSASGVPLGAVELLGQVEQGTWTPRCFAIANNGDILIGDELRQKPAGEQGLPWRLDYGAQRIEHSRAMSVMIRLNAAGEFLRHRLLSSATGKFILTELADGRIGVAGTKSAQPSYLFDANGGVLGDNGTPPTPPTRDGLRPYAFVVDRSGQARDLAFVGGLVVGNFHAARAQADGTAAVLFQNNNGLHLATFDWQDHGADYLQYSTGLLTWPGGLADGSRARWLVDKDRALVAGGLPLVVGAPVVVDAPGWRPILAVEGHENVVVASAGLPRTAAPNSLEWQGFSHVHGRYMGPVSDLVALDNGEWFTLLRHDVNPATDIGNNLFLRGNGFSLVRTSRTGVALEVIPLDYGPSAVMRGGNRIRLWSGGATTVHGTPVSHPVFAVDYDLRPFEPPQVGSITASPPPFVVNRPITFAVSATGDGTLSYAWRVNGIEIAGENGPTLNYTFPSDQYGEALVEAEVVNQYGAGALAELQVTVSPNYGPPAIRSVITGASAVRTGEWIELSIDAVGVGTLHYTWYRNGAPISGNDGPYLRLPMHTAALAVTEVFHVSVHNEAGSTLSNFHRVTVTNPDGAGGGNPATPLVSIDATTLNLGVVAALENAGTLGIFTAHGNPTVIEVDNVRGIRLDGIFDYFEGPVSTPEMSGSSPRTIEAWVHNPLLNNEETIVSWGRRGGPDGTNLAFNHGSNAGYGAVGHWGGGDIGWNDAAEQSIWSYVAYTYDGQTIRVYTNGQLSNSKEAALSTTPGTGILIGAQREPDGRNVTLPLRGSLTLGKLRIWNRALAASEIASTNSNEAAQFGRGAADPKRDRDGDGLTDIRESALGTHPNRADTDYDGFSDGVEVAAGSNPLQASSYPPIAPTTLIELDAGALPSGEIFRWPNAGSLGGVFFAGGDPEVQMIDGAMGVTFDGQQDLFIGPASIPSVEGASARTVEAWVFNPEIAPEETVIAWGRRGGPDGSNMAFNHGSHNAFGALGHWGAGDLGWDPSTSFGDAQTGLEHEESAVWTHIAYTYDGSQTRVFTNGTMTNSESQIALSTHPGHNFLLGSQWSPDGVTASASVAASLSIGYLRVIDGALEADEILASYEARKVAFTGGANTSTGFAVTDLRLDESGRPILRFQTYAGSTYKIQYSETLTSGSWIDVDISAGTDELRQFTDTDFLRTGRSGGYYRVVRLR